MPIRLTPVDYNPFPRVNLTPVDFNPFDVAEIARRQNAAGTAPPPDPRDVAAEQRRQDRNRGIEPAPQRTPQDAQRLNRIGAGREQVGDREALAIEQQAPGRQRELADNTDAANPDVRNTMAYIGTRLHQLNPQQYPWLFRNGAPLAAPEIADLISRSSDEIAGMSPQDATNYLFGRPEMRPANAAASLGQRSAPPRIQDPLLRNQTRGPDGSYQEYSGWDDSLRGLSNGDVRPDRTADLIAEQVTGNLGAAGKVAALIHTAVTGGAPGSGSYIWGQARSGLHSFLAATGQLLDDIQPFTTSDEDLAVLYRNDPQGLAEQRAGAVGALTRFIRDQQSSAVTSAQDISPQARLNYGNRTYATLDQAHAAWASPVRLLGDALQALPMSAALLLTTIATRGVLSEVESAALARGATAEAARAEGTAAAIRVATRVGAASEGAIGGAQQQVQTQNAIEAQPQSYFDASPQYRELISQGYDPAAARLYIAARAGRESGVGAGVTDAVTNLASGPILGRIIGEGGPLAGRIARGFVTEGTQEAVQGGGEQFSQNLATKQEADPNQSLVDGVLENVLQSFFVGGVTGGAAGGTFGHAEHRPGEIPTPTSAPGVPPGIREATAVTPPNITPEDQASPLPTELIAQGKKAAADALATTQADQLVGDNIGHGIGDHVAVTIGGQTRTGQIHDAFTEEDPETGTHHGAVIGWSDGTTTRERFSDLHDAGAQIRRTPLNEGDQPGRFAIAGGYTVGDGYGANRGDHVHHGVDMFARAGTPFPVGRPFNIVESHRQTSHGGIGGNVATVQFEDGSEWIAAHLPDLPRAGHYEAGADVIRAGNTGSASATESHVHWQPVNELAHTIYNQGRRTVAAYLTGGAAPAGAVAGAETDAAGPTPNFSWIDRPVDQTGAPVPAAAAVAPVASLAEADRGPAIGAATAAIDNHEANAPALQGSRRIGEDQTYTFGDGGSETRRYLHGSDGRVWRLSVDHETGDLTERMLVENPKTGDEYFTRDYRGGAEQPIQARPHQLQTYVAIDMSGNQAAPTGDGTRAAPITATTAEHVDQAAANAVQPTEGQAEAGNYQKGHVRVQGLDITIETPKGAERTGVGPDGERWSVTMPDHYGYVKRTTGADAEQVDVYVGPQPESPRVFVVDQNDHQTGQFDEHKAMLGYPSEDAARAAYHDAFSDGKGPDRVGAITEMSVPQFKEWLGSEQTTPAATAQLSDITGQQGSGGVTESVTPQPSADIGQFDPEPHVEAMRQYVANSTGSLNDTEKMGKALGLTSEQTHRVMGALAARKDSGIRMTKGRPAGVRRILVSPAVTELRGSKQVTVKAARYKTVTYRPAVPARFQRIGTRQAPLHFLEWVRAQGGVRSDRHDLRNVGALARHPGVINNRSGLSLDQLGERMPEAGWSTERPTESDVLEMLTMGSNAKVYRPEDSQALTDQGGAERAKAQADEGTLRALADEFGQKLDEAGFSRALEYLSQGKTPIQAITEAANDAGVDAVEALATETSDDTYVEIAEEVHGQSDATAAGQDDRNPSQGIAGPEGEQGDAGGSGQANAESTGAEKAPAEVATDLLGKPAEQPAPKAEAPTESQPDMLGTQPGDERRALERKGEGRKQSEATQKAPGSEGGLFDNNARQSDIEQTPIDQAKAALQSALDALNGKTAEAPPEAPVAEAPPAKAVKEEGPRYQRRLNEGDDPVFYSALERAVSSNSQSRASAEQWAATLSKTAGVKKEELEWSGVFDWLDMQKGPVSRDDLLGVIRDGGIKVEEVVLGGGKSFQNADDIYHASLSRNEDGMWEVHRASEGPTAQGEYETQEEAQRRASDLNEQVRQEEAQFASWSSDPNNPTYRELLITLPIAEGGNPTRDFATHWDQPAVIAHTRFMEKTDAEGKRVLFVEEIQSDRGQAGRDRGFEQPLSEEEVAKRDAELKVAEDTYDAASKELGEVALERARINVARLRGREDAGDFIGRIGSLREDIRFLESYLEEGDWYRAGNRAKSMFQKANTIGQENQIPAELGQRSRAAEEAYRTAELHVNEARQAASRRAEGSVPDMPFKSSWPALVMKRIIRWGADHGYDKVAWTTGDEQAERYNLDKHIDRVELSTTSGGIGKADMGPFTSGNFTAYDKNGREVHSVFVRDPAQLHDVLGKELTDKLIATAPVAETDAGMNQATRRLTGLDLRTGGEGMRQFYDKNLVNIANDLIKKHGGKVEPVEIGVGNRLNEDPRGATPEIREAEARFREAQESGEGVDEARAEITRLRKEWKSTTDPTSHPGFDITPALADAARSGFPLFQRAQAPPLSETDAKAIVGELERVLTKLDPNNRFTFKAAKGLLDFLPADAQGAYLNRVAYVSLDRSHNPVSTIIHEIGGHGFRALGLYSNPEWTALGKDAKERGYMDWAKRHYPTAPTAKQEEEAISEMIATFVSRRNETKGFVRTALQKVGDFVDALINAIRTWRTGNPQARQIMRQIESGKIGARPAGFGLDGEPRAPVGEPPVETQGAALFQARTPASVWNDQLNYVRDLTGAAKTPGKRDKIAAAFDRFRIKFQDRVLPLLRTQTAIERVIGRPLTEEEQPYRQEALYTGRVGDQFEKLADNIVEPMFEAMKENGVTSDELESYLYARHAPERNAKLEKEGVQDGSGMSDVEAAAILSRIEKAGKTEALKNVASWFDKLNAFAMETRIAGGLMNQEQADEWKSIYPNYAPLRGHRELPEEERPNMGQSGFSVKGPESRRAFGRKSLADDILAHAIVQAQEAVVRAEKNRVATELYNLAKANPDPNFWEIQKVTMKKRINKDTGMIESYAVTQATADDMKYTVNLKVNGKTQRVTFNRHNPAAVRAAEAMRRFNEPELNFKIFQLVNGYLSKVNTTLSPDFIVSNIARDLETATANLSGFDMKGLRRDVLASWPQAFKAAERGAFKRPGDSEWDQAWKDYSANGGRVSFNQIESVDQLRKDIAKRFSQASNLSPQQAGLKAWEGLKWTLDKIEKANMGAENATRLSVYKNLVDRGVSQKQSAFIAKEITTNFNRRGVYGALVNSLYLFANASIQGNARMIMALKHRRTQKIAGSMIVAGALVAMFNAAMGGNDDDGVPYYDKISDFEKANNLIFMLPGTGGHYIKIPMAYGYNIFPDLGRRTVDVLRGRAHAVDAGWGWLSNALNSFNPIGGQESIGNFLAPTVADPVIDLYVDNRDFADRPIMPDQPAFGPPIPDSQRFWPSIPPYYRAMTDALNRAGGGDQVRPGSVLGVDTSVSPETLQYLANQAFGSAGASLGRLFSIGEKAWNQDPENPIELNDIPVARRLVGAKPSWYDRAAFNARLHSVQEMVEQDREYHRLGDQPGQQRFIAANRDVLELHAAANQAQHEMQMIRRAKAQAEIAYDAGRITRARYDQIRTAAAAREERLFAAFNLVYLRQVHDPVQPQR